ncbi:MAG: hypothetical protein ABSB59_38650 [Streptosporangiaceae bacterium]
MRDRWSGLELRYLVTLAEVGRQASFSKAAAQRDPFIRLTQRAAEREQQAARLLD